MPTIGAPVGIRRPVVHFVGFSVELAGFHSKNSTLGSNGCCVHLMLIKRSK
jgi:hypothetical protein